jgi:hypothetical protein
MLTDEAEPTSPAIHISIAHAENRGNQDRIVNFKTGSASLARSLNSSVGAEVRNGIIRVRPQNLTSLSQSLHAR